MSVEIVPENLLDQVAGGTNVTLPPGFRGPWLPITKPPVRPWPPRFGVDPIPAPPGIGPIGI